MCSSDLTTFNAKTNELFVNVVNRSKDKDLTTAITTQDRVPEATVGVWQMNNADLKATHTYGRDTTVRPVTSTAAATVSGSTLTYTFPAHSLTILKVKIR